MRKRLAVLGLVFGMFVTAACSASAEGSEPMTIRFSWWGSASRAEVYNAICDEFEKAYPEYKVEREYSSGLAAYFEKFATQVAGKNAPDVVSMHPRYQADYVSKGVLQDLAPYIEEEIIHISDINESVLTSGMVDGVLYGLPQGVNVSEWFVNKTYCDRFGIEIPDENTFWTWDEFVENCYTFRENALAENVDAYFAEESMEYNYFRLYARSRGYEIFTEDGQLGHDEQLLADWWNIWKKLQEDDVIPSAEDTVVDKSASLEEKFFTLGKVATIEKAVSQYDQYAAASQFDIEIMHTPAIDGNNGVYIEGCHIGVSNQSDEAHKKAAALFVDFFVNDERSVSLLQIQQGIPANGTMTEVVYSLLSEDQQKIVSWINNWVDNIGLPSGINPPNGYSEIANLFEEYRQYVSFGDMTAEDAAHAFVEDAQSVLSK